MEKIFAIVWAFLNSPIGLTLAGSIVAWGLTRFIFKKPLWNKYWGTIISAIRYAEKEIPDNSEDKSIKKLDAALKYVLKVTDFKPTKKMKAALREGIQIVHSEEETPKIIRGDEE